MRKIPEPIRVPLAFLLRCFIMGTTWPARWLANFFYGVGSAFEWLGDQIDRYPRWWRRMLRETVAYHRARKEENA